jgi:dUTP pyrophosphatase
MSTTSDDEKFRVVRLNNNAKIPMRATSGSAGYDLYASEENIILTGNRGIVKTGLMIEIPKGYCGQVWPRSGFSVKNGIESGAGIIDSDYRGELMVILFNHSLVNFKVEKHMRMAQLLLVKIGLPLIADVTEESSKLTELKVTEELSKLTELKVTEEYTRGTGGFGSTGVK